MADALRGRLRRASPADVSAIGALVRECYAGYVERIGREPPPMTVNYSEAIRNHEFWVMEGEGALDAVLELIPAADHLLIENVAVRPGLQRHGIGRWLLGFAEEQARERGLAEMRLFTNEAFVENIVLYESLGYVETGRTEQGGSGLLFMSKRI